MREGNSLPLAFDGFSPAAGSCDCRDPACGNGCFANPSVPDLRRLMRWAMENPERVKEFGDQARKDMVAWYSPEVVMRYHLLPAFRRIGNKLGFYDDRVTAD